MKILILLVSLGIASGCTTTIHRGVEPGWLKSVAIVCSHNVYHCDEFLKRKHTLEEADAFIKNNQKAWKMSYENLLEVATNAEKRVKDE